ncbi:unnamed protein product [Musa hybrid cultivar]
MIDGKVQVLSLLLQRLKKPQSSQLMDREDYLSSKRIAEEAESAFAAKALLKRVVMKREREEKRTKKWPR